MIENTEIESNIQVVLENTIFKITDELSIELAEGTNLDDLMKNFRNIIIIRKF